MTRILNERGRPMRALLIDDKARAEVGRVVAYAMDHPYRPGAGSPVPGDDPGHVVYLLTYRCVFTFTHIAGRVIRHLTISVPAKEKYPNPIAAFHIAEMFGFTGYDEKKPDTPGPDWMCDAKKNENCVMNAQEI